MSRFLLVLMGDTHCGLKNGLIAPGTELDYSGEKKTVNILSWSEWLWHDVYSPGITLAGEIAGGDPVFVLHDGDVVHGSRFTEHLYSAWPEHQVAIAVRVMAECRRLQNLAAFAMVHGTGSHDFGENSATRKVAEAMAPWGLPVMVDDHIDVDLPDGFRVDLAHHGPNVGGNDYVRGNAARGYAKQRATGYLQRGDKFPDMIVRGHVHQDLYEPCVPVPWAGSYRDTAMFITPPLCGPNGYARQASRSIDRAICGMFFVEVLNGRIGTVYQHLVERSTKRVFDLRAYNNGNESQGDGMFG